MEDMIPLVDVKDSPKELLTLRNQDIFQEVRESNIFSQNIEESEKRTRTISPEDSLFDKFKQNTKSILDDLSNDVEIKLKSKNATTRLSQSDLVLNENMS